MHATSFYWTSVLNESKLMCKATKLHNVIFKPMRQWDFTVGGVTQCNTTKIGTNKMSYGGLVPNDYDKIGNK